MDKQPIKTENLRNTLFALYDMPEGTTIRSMFWRMGITGYKQANSCLIQWAHYGVVPDAVAAALHRDFPELAEAVLAGTLVIDGIERRALYSISLLRGELAALREDIKDVSNG